MIRGDTTAERLAALAPQPNTTQMTAGQLVAAQRRCQSPSSWFPADGGPSLWASSRWPGWWRRRPTPSTRSSWGSPRPSPSPRRSSGPELAPTDVDVWEVHEAFAAQALGVLRELPHQLDGFEVPDDRLNPNGGAVAIGHPFGSSGTRYVLTLATELHLRQAPLRRARGLRRFGPGGRPRAGESQRVLIGGLPAAAERHEPLALTRRGKGGVRLLRATRRRAAPRRRGGRTRRCSGSWWSIRPATPAPS